MSKIISVLSKAGMAVFTGYEIGKQMGDNQIVHVERPSFPMPQPQPTPQKEETHINVIYVVIFVLIGLIVAMLSRFMECRGHHERPQTQNPNPNNI